MNKVNYNEYHKLNNNKIYHSRRQQFIELMGGCCVDCGSIENLEFDHVDPSTKIFSIGDRLANASLVVLEEELRKCKLRCKSCHKAKSDSYQEVKHGAGKAGKKNCTCLPCKNKRAEYMRNYRKK